MFPETILKNLSHNSTYDLFWKFVAIWISMGLVRMSNIRSHFRNNFFVLNRVAKLFMSRNQFEKINRSLQGDISTLSKVFQENVRSFYKPSSRLTIDETILAFTGKSNLKLFVKGKPHPNGIKLYTLVDSCGILCSFFVDDKSGFTLENIFNKLLAPFPNGSLKIYTDRFFGHEKVMKYLQSRHFKFLMSMSKRHPTQFWNFMETKARQDGFYQKWWIKNKNVRAISIQVGKLIFNFFFNHVDVSSNSSNYEIENKLKEYPQLVMNEYNKYMGNVDNFSRTFYYAHLPIIRQQDPHIGFRRAILRMAVVNAYQMYRLYHNEFTLSEEDFLENLIQEILGFSNQGWKEFMKHFFVPSNITEYCAKCEKNKNCHTTHRCSYCRLPMCKKCFIKVHVK